MQGGLTRTPVAPVGELDMGPDISWGDTQNKMAARIWRVKKHQQITKMRLIYFINKVPSIF
jgi:hypothetical protein